MSYASVLAKNAPPEERQVHPDPSLLTRPEDIEHSRPISPGAPADDLVADKVHSAPFSRPSLPHDELTLSRMPCSRRP